MLIYKHITYYFSIDIKEWYIILILFFEMIYINAVNYINDK